MVEGTEQEAALTRREMGSKPLGADRVKGQQPENRPKRIKKFSAPLFHAASEELCSQVYEAYSFFVTAFRTAADKLNRGDPCFRLT